MSGALRGMLALLMLLVAWTSARAQQPVPTEGLPPDAPAQGLAALTDPLVRMEVRPLGDGWSREGEWTSVRVRLTNLGEPVRGVLELKTFTGDHDLPFRRKVELPAGSRKDIHLLWRPGLGAPDALVTFAAGSRSVSGTFQNRIALSGDVLVGVLGDDAAGVQTVRTTWSGQVPARAEQPDNDNYAGDQTERGVRVGLMPLDQLPDRSHPLMSWNWLVWPDADPSGLSPTQLEALRAYVANGGHLMITVTERWRQVGQGPLADMLPVTLTGIQDDQSARRLADSLGLHPTTAESVWPPLGDGPAAPAAQATVRDLPGRQVVTLSEDQDHPTWVMGRYGLGTVHVVTVDPRQEPLSQLDREHLWRRLLWLPPVDEPLGWAEGIIARSLHVSRDAAPSLAYGQQTSDWSNELFESYLVDIPGVAPLPMSWLLTFAAIYLLLIGPVDYFVLKALDRQPLTWITFPVTIVVFSGLALAGTSYIKGSQAVVSRFEVVDVLPGTGLWRGTSWYSVWSTRRADLSLTPGEGDGVALLIDGSYFTSPAVVHSQGGSGVTWGAGTWTLAYARTSWTAERDGTVAIAWVDEARVRIENRLGLDLVQVQLVDADQDLLYDGALADGAQVVVNVQDLLPYMDAPYPSLDDPTDAYWGWALGQVRQDAPEPNTGHVSLEDAPFTLLGVVADPIDTSILDGLSPLPRNLTVLRVPLWPSPAPQESL